MVSSGSNNLGLAYTIKARQRGRNLARNAGIAVVARALESAAIVCEPSTWWQATWRRAYGLRDRTEPVMRRLVDGAGVGESALV